MKGLISIWIATILLARTSVSVDLADLRSSPQVEPEYLAKEPGYLLLAFGREPSIRVWVVADEESVYIDRNANGDLTETGEKVPVTKVQSLTSPNAVFAELRTYDLGDIKASPGRTAYKNICLRQFRKPTKNFVAVTDDEKEELELYARFPFRTGNIRVEIGDFRQNAGPPFATSASDAPVVHFDGPLSLSIEDAGHNQAIEIDPATGEFPFQFRLGTPGLGPTAFAYTEAPLLPKMRVVSKDNQNEEQGGTVELRYCGANYCTIVRLPKGQISKVVSLLISVPEFAGRDVKPLHLDIKLKPR